MTNKPTIKDFFAGEKQYTIPVYQRAYSWEEWQWRVFLEDLEESAKGDNAYFFGYVLLEKTDNTANHIIDGQQRITTIIIFTRALCEALKNKANKGEKLNENIDNEQFIQRIEENYLLYHSKAKLQAVEYDRDYFQDVIIYNDDNKHKPQTPSQKRIKGAKQFFIKSLNKKNTKDILSIFKVMQEAEILSIFFANKKDSVLMFELQNNRGKQLTNMEKLKSYLAYQIYTYCDKEKAEEKLNEITKIFEEIYRLINDIKTADEDSILNYFNIFHCKFGFNYRENDNSINYKKELKEVNIDNKISWIYDYVKELKNAFVNFKQFENSNSVYKEYLSHLDVWEVYPFVLKAYSLFGNDDAQKLEQVFHILEIIAFRDKLVKTRADLASRLTPVLKDFKDAESLYNGLKNLCGEQIWYWCDEAVEYKLIKIFRENKDIIPYLLARYENHLREQSTDTKNYPFSYKNIKEPQIEHIAPQTENNKRVSSGYCKYDNEFSENYLHRIGNLMLMGESHNKAVGNQPFATKIAHYEQSPMSQHREIKDFANNGKWDKEAIDKRHEKIKEFVLKTWSFESL